MKTVLVIVDVIAQIALLWLVNLALGDTRPPQIGTIAMALAILALLRLRGKGAAS